jgi:glyoxylate reductase
MPDKKVVLVSRPPHTPEALKTLYDHVEVRINEGSPYAKKQYYKALRDVDGLFCDGDEIDAKLMDNAPKLHVIANFGVGYNNIDVEAAQKRGIAVTNTPEVLTDSVADLAIGLMIAVSRRIAEANDILKQRKPFKWAGFYLPSRDIHHKTLGIMGFGRIGQAVARRASGFNMRVIYYDIRRRSPNEEKRLNVEFRNLKDLLKEADFVNISCNLDESTHHLLGVDQLNIMKPSAYLINTSRGAVVDEKALIKALQTNKIAGAALDVFEDEPTIPKELLDAENTVVTPHMASGTYETRGAMTERCCTNLIMGLSGKTPQDLVNPPWKPRK